MKNYLRFLFLLFFLVLIDQIFKFSFSAISVCNKNIAWSISVAPGFFYFFWLVIFFLLIYIFLKSKRYFEKIALVLILSGAVSNMIDRVSHGCVIDFIDLKFWPVFNLADVYITIGVSVLIILNILRNSKFKAPNPK
jgi:signal peptidase II